MERDLDTFGWPTQYEKWQNSDFRLLTDRYSYNLNKFDTSKVSFKEICPKTHVFLIHFEEKSKKILIVTK